MKKGNVIFSKGTHNLYEILTKGVGGYMGGLDSQDLKDLYHLIGEELGEDCQNKKCYAVKMMLHRENPTILDIIENTEWKDYLKEEPSQPLKEGQEIDEGVFVRKFKDGGWEVHGFNEDSAKEVISALKMLIPSQPIKEEEGECCGEWTGKDSYDCDKDGARTKQGTCKCKCHQEKETPGEWITAFDPSCLKCFEKESLHFEHTRQEKETENYMIGDEDELLEPEYETEKKNNYDQRDRNTIAEEKSKDLYKDKNFKETEKEGCTGRPCVGHKIGLGAGVSCKVETPKKLPSPSARIQEIRERLYNQLPNKPEKQLDKTIAQIGCHSKAIEVYLHETAKL